jgi:hypothetical protein
MIRSRNLNGKAKVSVSHELEFPLRIIVFGLIGGLISSIGVSALIVMVEKVTPVPAGVFYLVLVSTITQSHSYSIYMIISGLLLHFVAGSLIGILIAIPFAIQRYKNADFLRIIDKYAPVYGICFGFVIWLVLFIPVTYIAVLPALNNIKVAPVITQQDPTGRVAYFMIGNVLSMQNRIIIGALAFNIFYGLVTAIIINALHTKYLYKKMQGNRKYY